MEHNSKKDLWWMPAMALFAKVSAMIAIPIVIALYLGKYLDKKFNTDPLWFLLLTGIAFIVSIVSLVKIAKNYIQDLEKEAKEKNGKSN